MIRPVVGGQGPHLETTRAGKQAGVSQRVHVFSGCRLLRSRPSPGTRLLHLCRDGPSRGAGARLAGKREFPKGDRPAFREVARRIPPTSPWDDTPGSAGVPPACCPFGRRSVSLHGSHRCRREPHGPGRSRGMAPLPVDSKWRKMAEAVPGFVRAGRPRSQEAFIP